MPLGCARCGAQNPDGNNFCQNCGSPLAVAAAVATQATPLYSVQPPAPPPAYQSPYYVPAQPQQIGRTPWMLVVGVIVGVVLVMDACGVGIAIVVPKNVRTTTGPTLGTPAPPNISETPGAKPTPTQATAGSQTLSIASLTVTVPADFQIADKNDNQVTVETPDGDGLIQVESAKLPKPTTAQQLQQGVLASFKQKYPDANVCGSDDNVEINGPSGSVVKICFTLTQQNAPATPAAAIYWMATNSALSVYYEVDGVTEADNFDGFMDATSPFVDSVSWKLT
jgi:zinc-ribbon domain